MLALTDEERPDYSFLCSGNDRHGPLALAAVDVEVLPMDLDHCPPDRWHGGVNMCEDMITAVRKAITDEKGYLAAVCEVNAASPPTIQQRWRWHVGIFVE